MSSKPGLIVERVSHSYPRVAAVQDASLEVKPGEVHCLLGPSGSGKSTLLRLVAGLEKLHQGRISIAGTEVAGSGVHHRPEERSVGFVFQDYALFPHLNVRRNVLFGMPRGRKADRWAAVKTLLNRVGMSGFESAMPHTLSGGQQQRVALARALAREPVVMLLDEPFSGLDAQLRKEVRCETLHLLRATGATTLMVTHDPREALVAGDVISVIRSGRIVQTGSPDDVYNRSASPEIAELFGPVNRLIGQVQNGVVTTPCGEISAPDFEDRRRIEVLVRPESIRLSRKATSNAFPATITEITSEGSTMRIVLKLQNGSDLESRDLSTRGWSVGADVFITVTLESATTHAAD